MKIIITFSDASVVFFVLFQSFTIMPTNKAEEQKHSPIRKYKDFEIRFYPSAAIEIISSSAKTCRDFSGSGFHKLAGYTFYSNKSNAKTSMISPVKKDINNSFPAMSFVMPSSYTIENLPESNDTKVTIKTSA